LFYTHKIYAMMKKLAIFDNYKIVVLLIYPLFFGYLLPAQNAVNDTTEITASIFKELQRDTVLELTLNTDTKTLIKKKYEEKWQAVTLNFATANNDSVQYNAKIRTRGNIRKEICYYPPLKLKFKKEWLNEKGLDSTYNDLKLVISCKSGDFYRKLVLKEYLIYQLYAAMTEFSFKTQLVSVKLKDSNNKKETIESMGFIIENQEEMAAHFDGRCLKPKIMGSRAIDPNHWAFLSLFEYMIGNTDWSMPNSHNIRFMTTNKSDKVIPVAYDFDYSGLVNAPYAIHRESINIEEITTRYFLGSCKIYDQLAQQVSLFLDKKAKLYKIVNGFDLLSDKDRKRVINYLDEFYAVIEAPKSFKRSILDSCIEN